ncbi:nucleolin, partial [Taenia solium]
TQKKNRNPNVQSTKANGPSVTKSVGKKRPREEDSGDDDSENKLDAAQVKKLKQMIVEDADDSGSTELDVEGESEGDSDEDSEEYGDEDDSDHNGDTEDEFPEKVVKLTNSREKAQQQHQQTPVKSNPEKSKGSAKQLEPKVRAQEQFKVSTSNILLFNIPRLSENELHGFLAKRNVHPESISCINSPVALLGFADDATAKKAISACSGAAYSQNSLAAVSITGGDIGLIRSSKNPHPGRPDAPLTCLFVTSIPKSVTEKEILKIAGVEPKHLRLITSGRKNHVFNACYVDCNSEGDAKKAFQALQNHRFGESQVKVFLKPQSNFNPVTETSLIVANVPFSAEIDDVKKQFPAAKKVELTRRGCFMLSFDSAEERAKILKESEGKVMGGRALRFITSEKSNADYSVFVSNVAFAVTADELRAAFPGCRSVFMMKKKDGRFNGNAIVHFATREAAEAAAQEGAKKELKGRVLKTKMQDGSAGPSTDIKSSAIYSLRLVENSEKPKPRAENKAKTELPAQVGSESEEEEEEGDEEEEEEEDDDDDEEIDEGDSGDDSVDEEADEVEGGDVSDSDAEEDGPVSKRSKQDQTPAAKGRGGKREARGGRGGGFVNRGNRGGGRFQNRGGRGGRGRGGPFKK